MSHRWLSAATLACGCGRPEVRFPQNCVVLVSGCCCVALEAEVHRLVALCSVCLGIVSQGKVRLVVRLAAALVSSPCCSFLSFSAALVGLRVPVARMVCFISRALRALPGGGLVSAVGVWLVVLLVEASVLRCGYLSRVWKRLVMCVSFLYFLLVARGGDAPLWCCVAKVRIVATF
ncbi:hypothetical protein Taro_014932 [Colocasia esculenta]|uniref:Uncharacterized protein n=1 Tax=Colocasia esculenta TaxID=4460 RepID=A0A843UG84_COLES|nr:hypothetical protein [Colocasia esculenta]